MRRASTAVYAWLALGYAFFYLPIILLVLNSFNASRVGSHWGGFSLQWYGELFRDRQVLDSAWLSLKIAFMSACGATLLGGLAGLALGRMGPFRGRTALSGMVAAPLVMPEVITGLSLLLLFVSLRSLIGWPQARGELTITIAHITFCMAYVAVIVQSRVATMDASLEEAAMDLGGRPFRVIGACTGTDAHTVGIDAILNMKGIAGHKGLESYKGFEVRNLGAQVPNEDLIAAARDFQADAVLVSQVVTQKNVHIHNLTRFIELVEAEGLRDRWILVVGGPRITHELAMELGFDAGFGRQSFASHVASFLVQEMRKRVQAGA